jgi:hypothetical protein
MAFAIMTFSITINKMQHLTYWQNVVILNVNMLIVSYATFGKKSQVDFDSTAEKCHPFKLTVYRLFLLDICGLNKLFKDSLTHYSILN